MARFSKEALRRHLLVCLANRQSDYLQAAGKPIDPGNGTAQIPTGNTEAATAYGQWYALERLWEAVRDGEVSI